MNSVIHLKSKISKLPMEIQRRIYIFAMKKMWQRFIPITAKVPTWYLRKVEIDNMIYQSRLKNIHFLHLPFNIVEENKKWIMGCQCSFCIQNKKGQEIKKQISDPYYFEKSMPESTEIYCNQEYFYSYKIPEYEQYCYDPLCGTIYENDIRYALRTNNIQLDFVSN